MTYHTGVIFGPSCMHATFVEGRREKGRESKGKGTENKEFKEWRGRVSNFSTCLLPVMREEEVGRGSICQGQRDRQDSQS